MWELPNTSANDNCILCSLRACLAESERNFSFFRALVWCLSRLENQILPRTPHTQLPRRGEQLNESTKLKQKRDHPGPHPTSPITGKKREMEIQHQTPVWRSPLLEKRAYKMSLWDAWACQPRFHTAWGQCFSEMPGTLNPDTSEVRKSQSPGDRGIEAWRHRVRSPVLDGYLPVH